MGRQSRRLYFQGYDHSGIAMAEKGFGIPYNHAKMYRGNRLLWERMPASVVAFNNSTGAIFQDEGSFISTSDDLEHFSVIQYGISIPGISEQYIRNPKILQIITFAGHYVCSYSYRNTLENKTINLLLRSNDGYEWEAVEDFYTSRIGWIGKHIIDGEECLAAFKTGVSGAMNSDITGFYYGSDFIRKKYSYIENIVGNFSIYVYGYNTLYLYVLGAYDDYKIAVVNGNKTRKEKTDIQSGTLGNRIYNYADDSLYVPGKSAAGNLAMRKLNFLDETTDILVYDIGIYDAYSVYPCYSDEKGVVVQAEFYDGITIFVKMQDNQLVKKTEHKYEHVYTSNGASLLAGRNEGNTLDGKYAVTDDIFGGKIRDIKINALSELYQNRTFIFLRFAYLKRNQ